MQSAGQGVNCSCRTGYEGNGIPLGEQVGGVNGTGCTGRGHQEKDERGRL